MPTNGEESRLKNTEGRRPASGEVVAALPAPVAPAPPVMTFDETPRPSGGLAARLREARGSGGRTTYEPPPIPELLQPVNIPAPSVWKRVMRLFGKS
jgi:hypothetical protein